MFPSLFLIVLLVGKGMMAEFVVVKLTSSKLEFTALEPILIQVEIQASAHSPLLLSAWDLPSMDPLYSQFTILRSDGTLLNYIGRLGKQVSLRLLPRPEVRIEANGSLIREIDLALLYDFSLTTMAATYSVRFTPLGSNTIDLFVHPRRAAVLVLPRFPMPSWTSCSSRQRRILRRAKRSALKLTARSNAALASMADEEQVLEYQTWFGKRTRLRARFVRRNFIAIEQTLLLPAPNSSSSNSSLAFDCTCKEDYAYAYVYARATPHKTVYLCNAYWKARRRGMDSQPGVLIHEISHFEDVAATRDHAYGEMNCRVLALSSPALAIANADSHEYFAENI